MLISFPDDKDLLKLGTEVIQSGWLALIREEFSLSMVSLAQLLGSYAATVKTWENGSAILIWKESARRVGTFYLGYLEVLGRLQKAGIDPRSLMPLRTASMYLGKPSRAVEADCMAGELTCLNLGVMGSYVWKEDVGQ